MRYVLRWVLLDWLVLGAVACGGATAVGERMDGSISDPSSASEAGVAPSEAGANSGSGADAASGGQPPATDASAGSCALGGFGGSGSSGGNGTSCEWMADETCGTTSYQVSCSCPRGACTCIGSSTTSITFAGCPTCPMTSQAFTICGFPQ